MNPETRAARDRLRRLLTTGTGQAVIDAAIDADLHTVLAALERHDTTAIERCPLCGGDVTKNAIAPLCDGAPHGRTRREYDPAVRTPRDLDPPDGSIWDLPRDEPEDEGA